LTEALLKKIIDLGLGRFDSTGLSRKNTCDQTPFGRLRISHPPQPSQNSSSPKPSPPTRTTLGSKPVSSLLNYQPDQLHRQIQPQKTNQKGGNSSPQPAPVRKRAHRFDRRDSLAKKHPAYLFLRLTFLFKRSQSNASACAARL
jgi:hypothetical protein